MLAPGGGSDGARAWPTRQTHRPRGLELQHSDEALEGDALARTFVAKSWKTLQTFVAETGASRTSFRTKLTKTKVLFAFFTGIGVVGTVVHVPDAVPGSRAADGEEQQ